MSIENIILLIAGLINLIMSIIVFARGVKHNKINLYFSLFTFFSFTWAMGLFFSRILLFVSDYWILWSNSCYISALGIILSLYFFSIHFPFKIRLVKPFVDYFLIILSLFFVIIIFNGDLFITDFYKDSLNDIYILYFNNILYLSYSFLFIFISTISITNFLVAYRKSELFFKKQILYLLIFIIFGLLLSTYFDLFLCYFGIFNYNWLGPLFTFPINLVAFYLIFYQKQK